MPVKNAKSEKTARVRRRVLILLGGVLLVAGAGTGAYAYRAHRLHAQIARWRADGIAAARRGDSALAVERLTSYLSYNPTDREALLAFVDVRPLVESPDHRQLAETARALRYLVQLEPNDVSCRVRLLDLYWKLGLRTESVDAAAEILRADPGNCRALDVQSSAFIALKRYDEALKAARRWSELAPTSLTAHCRILALRGALGHPESDVLADVDAWGKQHPDDSARCELLRACAYATFNDRENELSLLRRAATRQPPDDEFADVLIARLADVGEGTEDLDILKGMASRGAGQRARQRLLGRLWELGRYQEMLKLASGMNLGDPALPTHLLAIACMADNSSGHAADATATRQTLRHRSGASAEAWNAILDSSRSDPVAARAVEAACKRALSQDPQAPYIRYFLGEALASLGENQLAIEALQQEGAASPTWGLPLARAAELLLDRGNASRAALMATVALKRNPTAITGLVVARVAAAMLQQGHVLDGTVVLNLLDQLDRSLPGDDRVRLVRAQVLAANGKRDKAAALLREFLKDEPSKKSSLDAALLRQAAAVSRAGQLGVDAELLARAEQLHGMSPALALDKALAAAARGDQQAGLKIFDDAVVQANGTAGQRRPVEWSLNRALYLDLTDDSAAVAAWRALGDEHVDNLTVQQSVLAARASRKDRALRERTISRLSALVGEDSIVCGLARAELMIDGRSSDADDRAIAELLKRIIATHPTFPEPRVLWATHLEREGKVDEAIDQVQLAVAANPDLASLAMKLSSLYRKKGDYDRALNYAQGVAASKASSPAEVRRAAQTMAQLGDEVDAIAALERLSAERAPLPSELAVGDLMLTSFYWDRGEIQKADALITRMLASPVAAAQPEVLSLAARFYASQGRFNEKTRVLGLIDALTLPASRKDLIHAETLAASGDVAAAERLYRQAVAAAPADPVPWWSLISYLYARGRATDAASETDAALARLGANPPLSEVKRLSNTLAVVCQLDEMRPVMQDYLRDPLNRPESGEILTAIARASNAGVADAAGEARTLSQRFPRIEGVQLWAVRTFLRARRLADAAPTIARVMRDFPESSEAAAVATTFYATQLMWHEMLDAARQWRQRVRGPASSNEVERAETAVARALVGVGHASEAANRLKPFAVACIGNPGEHADLLLTYADALRITGQLDAANALLSLAASDAGWRRACVRFAAEKLDARTASSWLGRLESWAQPPSTDELCQIAEAWAVLSSRSSNDPEYTKRAEERFLQIESLASPSAVVIERAAVFAERSGDFPKAISLYRRAVAIDRTRGVAWNNLANLLASRGQPGDTGEAARCAAAALQARPDEPEFLDTLSFVDAKARNYPAAEKSMSRAVELDPENVRWRVALAQLFADGGQTDQASRAVTVIDAMAVDPDTLAPPLREQLKALRARLKPAGDPTASKAAATGVKRAG